MSHIGKLNKIFEIVYVHLSTKVQYTRTFKNENA